MNGRTGTGVLGRRLSMVIMALLCLTGGLLASMPHALAHASLVRVEPADGSVIAAAPRSFTLVFSEPTSPLVLKLVAPDGTAIPLERFALRDSTLDIEAPADLGNGTYVLSWRIVSEDGHPVGGSAVFSIGAPSGAGASAAGPIDWPVRAAIWVAKIVLYVSLFIGVGGSFFMNWLGGRLPQATRLVFPSLIAGLVAVPLSVGFQGLDALGEPLSGLADPQAWATGYSTSYGLTALIAFGALISAAIALVVPQGAASKALACIALLAAGAALAASGHASAAQPQWLTRPAVFLHGVGIAFWAGSLAPLGAALASPSAGDAAAVLRRFSRAIPLAVLVLVIAGGALAAIQLRSVDALWTTDYGKLLLVKSTLLALLFLLAALNRFRLTEPVLRGDVPAIRQLRRSIGAELALVLVIFAVAAGWRFTPPPRSLAEAAAVPASVHIHTDRIMADLTIAPGRAGPVRASVAILDGEFAPLEAKEVSLVLSNTGAGIEQIRRTATRSEDGTWIVDALNLPLPGRWQVRIDILVSDFEMVKIEDGIDIRP